MGMCGAFFLSRVDLLTGLAHGLTSKTWCGGIELLLKK